MAACPIAIAYSGGILMRFFKSKLSFATRGVAALAMGLGMLIGIAAVPAAAAECQLGTNCHWYNNNFDGASVNMRAHQGSFSGAVLDNRTQSLKANGTTCMRSYFYKTGNWSNAYIWLYSDDMTTSGQNEDPNLSNGGGYGPYNGENWSDVISSYKFSHCE
jgi:hypothetical protein